MRKRVCGRGSTVPPLQDPAGELT